MSGGEISDMMTKLDVTLAAAPIPNNAEMKGRITGDLVKEYAKIAIASSIKLVMKIGFLPILSHSEPKNETVNNSAAG